MGSWAQPGDEEDSEKEPRDEGPAGFLLSFHDEGTRGKAGVTQLLKHGRGYTCFTSYRRETPTGEEDACFAYLVF